RAARTRGRARGAKAGGIAHLGAGAARLPLAQLGPGGGQYSQFATARAKLHAVPRVCGTNHTRAQHADDRRLAAGHGVRREGAAGTRLRVLGRSGGNRRRALRTTSFLLDSDILIDAGTGVGDLTLAELSR